MKRITAAAFALVLSAPVMANWAESTVTTDQRSPGRDAAQIKREACEWRAQAPIAISGARRFGLTFSEAVSEAMPFFGYELAITAAEYIYAGESAKRVSDAIYDNCIGEPT